MRDGLLLITSQETLNYWKQLTHVLKYFRTEEDPKARLPSNFINGFLEVRTPAKLLRTNDFGLTGYNIGTELSATALVPKTFVHMPIPHFLFVRQIP